MKKNKLHNRLTGRFLALLIVFLVLFPSCNENEILKETPLSFLSSENAYTTPEGIEMGIVGIYNDIRTAYYLSDNIIVLLFATGTDLAYCGESPGVSGAQMNNYETDCVPDGGYPGAFWGNSYTIIQYANVLIDAINNNVAESEWTDESEKNALMGEAMFFRAWAYRFLVYLYGDVPLQTEPVSSAKVDFVRTDKSEIYELIESDLTFAAENLPAKGEEAASGRITQGVAWHLLSEIYLAQEEYQSAVDAASHVINDYGYALMTERFGNQPNIFGNENVYFDLFTKDNQDLSENTETLWTMQFDYGVTGGGDGGYAGPRAYGPAYHRMGYTPDGYTAFRGELYNGSYTGYSDTLNCPVAWARPTNYVAYDIWQSDWDNDYRNAEACIKRHFYYDNPESAYHGMEVDWSLYKRRTSPLKDTCQYIFPYFMKVNTPCDIDARLDESGGGFVYKDIYVFRLAETYLLRAEGYLGLGNTAQAAADINVVRNRSNASSVSAGEVTIDYILDERVRELYTEETRLLTLMRLGKLYERVTEYNNNPLRPGLNIQEHNNLYPIPQGVIDLNTGAVMEQNPGY